MKFSTWSFQFANQNLPLIILIGVGLGVANYALGVWSTLGQSLLQQVTISLVIGYSLILVADNSFAALDSKESDFKNYGLLIIVFGIIGVIGTEVEELVRSYAFNQEDYRLFDLGGKHLFNFILSIILGWFTFNVVRLKNKNKASKEISKEEAIPEPDIITKEPLTAIPIRQGETFLLYSLDKIMYFESYDNYSFLFDTEGKKHLCNYSLLFLEKRLEKDFLRVHRKYLIHTKQIAQITPHMKGRFTIRFKGAHKNSITSSTSYTAVVKSLIKL